MVNLALLSRSSISTPIQSSIPRKARDGNFSSSLLNFKTESSIPRKARRLLVFAERDNWYNYERECGYKWDSNPEIDQAMIFEYRWSGLAVPEPGDDLPIGFKIFFIWVCALSLYHLWITSLAIYVGAVKHSIIAALLIFVLSTILYQDSDLP